MAARHSGTKIVVAAVTTTLVALGVGTVYAPFYADRDKLRGLHEEEDGGLSEESRREYEQYLRQIAISRGQDDGAPLPQQDGATDPSAVPPKVGLSSNSMWSRLKQATSKDPK